MTTNDIDAIRGVLAATASHFGLEVHTAGTVGELTEQRDAARAAADELRRTALDADERQRAANAIKAYIRLCGSRIPADHPYHAIAAKLADETAGVGS